MGSALGLSDDKILQLERYADSPLYDDVERLALRYADAITLSEQDVDDETVARLREHFSDDAVVELTEIIAWENASSKFNRALRIPAQNFWRATTDHPVSSPRDVS